LLTNSKTGDPVPCPLCNGTGKMAAFDRLWFSYLINETIAAALGTNLGSLRIEPRADFEWVACIGSSTGGVWSTQLTDASGRTYQNLAVNSENQWGTAQRPFWLQAPIVLPMRSAVNYVLVDRSANVNNAIQLVLSGFELYPIGG
jgi:hypothetical protein